MKLAIIFLCLSIASFFGTSEGNGGGSDKSYEVSSENVSITIHTCVNLMRFCYAAETCPDSERSMREKDACIHLQLCLSTACKCCGKTPKEVLDAMECSKKESDAILSGNAKSVKEACGSIDKAVKKLLSFVECVLGKLGYTLKALIGKITGFTGKGEELKEFLGDLGDNLEKIQKKITGKLQDLLGNLSLTDGVTSVAGGLGGLLGGSNKCKCPC